MLIPSIPKSTEYKIATYRVIIIPPINNEFFLNGKERSKSTYKKGRATIRYLVRE